MTAGLILARLASRTIRWGDSEAMITRPNVRVPNYSMTKQRMRPEVQRQRKSSGGSEGDLPLTRDPGAKSMKAMADNRSQSKAVSHLPGR